MSSFFGLFNCLIASCSEGFLSMDFYGLALGLQMIVWFAGRVSHRIFATVAAFEFLLGLSCGVL